MKLTCRRRHIAKQHDVVHDRTDSHIAVEDKESGKDNDKHHSYLLNKRLQAFKGKTCLTCLQLIFCNILLKFKLFLSFYLLTIKRFDDGDALKYRHDTVALSLTEIFMLSSPPFQFACLQICDIEIDRDNHKCDGAYIDILFEHQHQRKNSTAKQRQDIDEEVLDYTSQALHSPINTCLQFARFIARLCEKGKTVCKDSFYHILC